MQKEVKASFNVISCAAFCFTVASSFAGAVSVRVKNALSVSVVGTCDKFSSFPGVLCDMEKLPKPVRNTEETMIED